MQIQFTAVSSENTFDNQHGVHSRFEEIDNDRNIVRLIYFYTQLFIEFTH